MRALVEECRAKGSKGFSVKIGREPVIDVARIVEAFKDKKPDEWFQSCTLGAKSREKERQHSLTRMKPLLRPSHLTLIIDAYALYLWVFANAI